MSGTTLRAVKVWDIAQDAIRIALSRGTESRRQEGETTVTTVDLSHLTAEEAVRVRRQGPTDETLGWVAYFYNTAEFLGLPPAREVEMNLNVPRPTASKWVRRAKEKGLISGEH